MLLNGWKEIAQHLRCSVRTAQRWEPLGLPIHRPKLNVGPVFAFAENLDDWLKATPQLSLIEYAANEDKLSAGFRHRVLVVDDDDLTLDVYSDLLRRAGYDVRTALNGFEALAVMREGGVPDLLVSDLNMPGMSGFELLGVVRKRFPGVVVIAISGAYTPLNRPEILADIFLDKSMLDPDQLTCAAKDLLERAPLRAQPARAKEPVAWVPCSASGYFVVTCTHCLRSFSVPAAEARTLDADVRAVCVHCGTVVAFRVRPISGSKHKVPKKKVADLRSKKRS